MSAPKHSPGPWRISNVSATMVVAGDGRRGVAACSGYSRSDFDTTPENQANARLIAAAPELLEAVQAVLRHDIFGDWLPAELEDQLKAAIAKATAQ